MRTAAMLTIPTLCSNARGEGFIGGGLIQNAVFQLDNVPQLRVNLQSQRHAQVVAFDLELLAKSDESNLSLLLKTLQNRIAPLNHVEVISGIEDMKLRDIEAIDLQPTEAVFDGVGDSFGGTQRSVAIQVFAFGGQHIGISRIATERFGPPASTGKFAPAATRDAPT